MRINFNLGEYSSIEEQCKNLKTVNEKILYLKRIEADVKRGVVYLDIPDILEKLQIDIDYLREVKALQPEVKTKDEPPNKKGANKMIDIYIGELEKQKVSSLTPKDLEDNTGISSSKWYRKFNDPIFVGALQKALKKKESVAGNDITKQNWQYRIVGTQDLIDKIYHKTDALSKKTVSYNDNHKQNSIDSDIEDSYNEEINKPYGSKNRAKLEQE